MLDFPRAGHLSDPEQIEHGADEQPKFGGHSKQEEDSNQPRPNQERLAKRGATSVAWRWFGYEESGTANFSYHPHKNHVKRDESHQRTVERSEPTPGSDIAREDVRRGPLQLTPK